MSQTQVPFLDLVSLHAGLKDEIHAVVETALNTAGFIGGKMVQQFEEDFAKFCDTQYCVGLGSGTDAVRFALMAAGVQNGDVVLTVPNTFIATTEGISQAGARPDFVDIDESTYNMDPEKLRRYLEEQCSVDESGRAMHREFGAPVTAIVPVHLYGQPADMDALLELAEKYKLIVVEDSCQAHGSEYKGKRSGSIGIAGCFSFYPGKNLGAYGEAGAIVTNNDALAEKVMMLRDHGQAKKYYHDWIGWNARMDGFQGAVLTVKLKHLSKWNEARRDHARKYNTLLAGIDKIHLPIEAPYARHIYHVYAIQTPKRDGLISFLGEKGISCGIHYPVPVHLQKAYSFLKLKNGGYPVAERCCAELVSLPMYPELTDDEAKIVIKTIGNFFKLRQ